MSKELVCAKNVITSYVLTFKNAFVQPWLAVSLTVIGLLLWQKLKPDTNKLAFIFLIPWL